MTSIETLKATFAQCFDLPIESITDELRFNRTPQWDSVAHMALIAAIEEAFDILIETDDVINMNSFAKAKEIIAKYGVAF